jgi:adenylyltransferase/sulfurtransferase
MRELNGTEAKRYARQLALPEMGEAGQRRLKEASVLLVGTGGLGSASSMYLAAAGVGRIGILDFDVVDVSNLHRQIIHGESTLGQKKVESAKRRLLDINPHIDVETYDCRLDRSNALEIIREYDIVADGTDNFPTRYLVNDACQLLGKANVYASVFRFEGQVSVFDARRGPCYRCLFREAPPPGEVPSCAEGGVLGVLPGIAGTLQATEVIKLITGIGEPLIGRLLTFDALSMDFVTLKVKKDPGCVLCGPNASLKELVDCDQITARELRASLSEVCLVDVREQYEWEQARIEGARLIPLSEFVERLGELNRNDRIVLYCKTGGRSMQALNILKERGFENVRSLDGGITNWKV